MYRDKTTTRLSVGGGKLDNIKKINGVEVEPIMDLINKIDWTMFYLKLPSKFHGDLQLENIIYTNDGEFILIDWRESFGSSKEIGDVYYDLGKIYFITDKW